MTSAKFVEHKLSPPHVHLDLWRNTPARFHSNPCKDVGGSWEDKLKCVKILSVKDHNSAKTYRTWIISPHALLDLWPNIPAKFYSNPCKDVGGVEKDKLKCVKQAKMCKNSKCQGPLLCQNLPNINYLPTCTFVVQHPCQVSFKSM